MNVMTPMAEELSQLMVTTLELTSQNAVIWAPKIARLDWRNLVEQFEAGGTGLKPPYVVIRPMKAVPVEFGMHNLCFIQPVDIIYIESFRNRVATTVTAGTTSDTQPVASTANMFVGQRLWFKNAKVYRTVQQVVSATSVRLDSSVITITNDVVRSDTLTDVWTKLSLIKDQLTPGSVHTNFQIVDDVAPDIADHNEANTIFAESNQQMFAGILSCGILVGETL